METRVVTAHLPLELALQLDRPKGWIIRQALAYWVVLETKRHQLTLEGLADVDAGRVVDHSAATMLSRPDFAEIMDFLGCVLTSVRRQTGTVSSADRALLAGAGPCAGEPKKGRA